MLSRQSRIYFQSQGTWFQPGFLSSSGPFFLRRNKRIHSATCSFLVLLLLASRTAVMAFRVAFRRGRALGGPQRFHQDRKSAMILCYSQIRQQPRDGCAATRFFASAPAAITETPTKKRQLLKYCNELFDLMTPEGRCVGIELQPRYSESLNRESLLESGDNHWVCDFVHPSELEFAITEVGCDKARQTFLLGRLAMRRALSTLNERSATDLGQHAILKDDYGRPCLPAGCLGSISHKNSAAVALVCGSADDDRVADCSGSYPRLGVGVDLEETSRGSRRSIAPKVLTNKEREQLGQLAGISSDEEVLLRFGLKESLYKAMHPLICQYVGFMEVEIQPTFSEHGDQIALVSYDLQSRAHERFGITTAHWQRQGNYFLSTASVQLDENAVEGSDDELCDLADENEAKRNCVS